MRVSLSRAFGRVDPFGLLILAVVLALMVTIGIQAQASAPDSVITLAPQTVCDSLSFPCMAGDMRR